MPSKGKKYGNASQVTVHIDDYGGMKGYRDGGKAKKKKRQEPKSVGEAFKRGAKTLGKAVKGAAGYQDGGGISSFLGAGTRKGKGKGKAKAKAKPAARQPKLASREGAGAMARGVASMGGMGIQDGGSVKKQNKPKKPKAGNKKPLSTADALKNTRARQMKDLGL